MRNLDLISRSILETKAIISLNSFQFSIANQQQLLTVQYNRCSSQRSKLTQLKRDKSGSFIQVSRIPIIALGWCTFMGKRVGSQSPPRPPPYCHSISPHSEALDVPDETERSDEQEFLVLQSLFLGLVISNSHPLAALGANGGFTCGSCLGCKGWTHS